MIYGPGFSGSSSPLCKDRKRQMAQAGATSVQGLGFGGSCSPCQSYVLIGGGGGSCQSQRTSSNPKL